MAENERLASLEVTVDHLSERIARLEEKIDKLVAQATPPTPPPSSSSAGADLIARALFALVGLLAGAIGGYTGKMAVDPSPPAPKIQYVPAPADLQAPRDYKVPDGR